MNLKKLTSLALALTMTASLAACSGSPSKPSEAPAESQAAESVAPVTSDLKVGVFYYQYSDVYITSVRTNMDAKLTDLGVTFQDFDGANSQPTQTDQINTAITDGYNFLIVNIVETASPEAAQGAVDAAKAKDIPIVFFNREVSDEVVNSYEKCAFVGTNAPEAGHLQGKMIGEYLVANWDTVDLNGDGKISYALMKGQEGNAEAEARSQYGVEDANAVLTAAGKPELSYFLGDTAATKYQVDPNGAWSSQAGFDFMSTNLSSYSDANKNMIELVICNNDGMAEGVVSALQSVGYNTGDGKSIPVFGVDATESAKALIKAGQMTATVKQDAVGMAETICALTANVKDGKAVMEGIADTYNVDSGVAKVRVPYGVYDATSAD